MPKGPSVSFTQADLDALQQNDVSKETPWHDGVSTFAGRKLRVLLDAAGASGKMITAHALSDYSANSPVEDAENFGVILATRVTAELLPIRDKGPIFVIYPYDSDPTLQHDVYCTRSVWQGAIDRRNDGKSGEVDSERLSGMRNLLVAQQRLEQTNLLFQLVMLSAFVGVALRSVSA